MTLLSLRGKPVMIEPSWKEARGVAISSLFDILLVGAPGACKSQPLQFFGMRVGGGARQGDLMRNRAMKRLPKNLTKNHFPTNNNLLIAGRGYEAAVVTDIKLFRPRKHGNGKAPKKLRGNISKKLNLSPL